MLNDAVSEDRLSSVVNKVSVKPWHYIPLSEQKMFFIFLFLTLVYYSLGKGITIHWRRLSTVPSVKSWLFRASVVNHRAHTQQFSPLRSFCHLPLRMLDINKHVSFTQHTVACICKPSPSTTVKRWDPSQKYESPPPPPLHSPDTNKTASKSHIKHQLLNSSVLCLGKLEFSMQ